MDEITLKYNRKAAAETLARICNERAECAHSNLQLGSMFKPESDTSYAVERDRAIWRLIRKDDEDMPEEVVTSLQGILCKKELPPFTEKNIPSKKVKYLRQSATVTAFGHSVYDGLIANIATIHSIFKRGVGDRLTEDSVNSMFEEWPAIDAANRYFTPKAVARLEDIRSIGIDVDPFGSLNKAASSSFVHTEENKVYYFERKGSANGDTAFRTIEPQLIKNGDIVELQVSFIAVPTRDNRYRISTVLRSISILDGQFSQDAYVKRLTENSAPPKQPRALKRKVGYAQEEVSKTRAKLDQMAIDDPTEKAGKHGGKESEPEESNLD